MTELHPARGCRVNLVLPSFGVWQEGARRELFKQFGDGGSRGGGQRQACRSSFGDLMGGGVDVDRKQG